MPLDPKDDKVQTTYNFTIGQQAPFHSMLEVAYVGNQSGHLATQGNLQNQNVIPLGAQFGPDPAIDSTSYNQMQPDGYVQVYADYRSYPNYTSIYVEN